MHLESYLEACFPAPCRVLGVGLQPFTLGHSMVLQWLNSPFVKSGLTPGLGDLLLAIEVCRCDFPAIENILRDQAWTKKLLRWNAFKHRFTPKAQIESACLHLVMHIARGSAMPPLCSTAVTGKEAGAPVEQRLSNFLRHYFGLTEIEALNTPLAKAFWEYSAWQEREGGLEIENSTHRAMLDTIKSMGGQPFMLRRN